MQVPGYSMSISHTSHNRDVLKIVADLVGRHPHMRLSEILDAFNIIKVKDDDKHTPSDVILARTHRKLHELNTKQWRETHST